jgi:hypothetical protein
MAIEIGTAEMSSDDTPHRAKWVGEDNWAVSYLPGRTLSTDQAVMALQIAGAVHLVDAWAAKLGLTAREAFGLAATACTWPEPRKPTFWGRRRLP